MKKLSLLCSFLLATAFTEKLAAQCEVHIAREAYGGNGPCELPVVLRAAGGTSLQAITWYENGSLLQEYKATWPTAGLTTYAGTGTAGSANDQVSGPSGICLDRDGNLYIADKNNHRVQKWAPGATNGTTVAGTGTSGSANDQLNSPADVFVDSAGNIYVADLNNHRIQKWAPGAAGGTTVAGTGTSGSGSDQLSSPSGVFATNNGTVYIADAGNHRIQKWDAGATSGTTVAGNGTSGSSNNQLNNPADVYLDPSGNIYIADKSNHRIQKWAAGATGGTTVAGTGTSGSANDQLNNPTGIYVDGIGNLYITDVNNQRVQFWEPNATSGSMIADHTMGSRPAPAPTGVALDSAGNMYMSDMAKNYVLRYAAALTDTLLVITPATYKLVTRGFDGCAASDSLYVVVLPDATLTPAGSQELCQGANILLHTNSTPGLTYQWHRDGTDIPQATDSTYAADATGTYTVTIHNGPDCAATSADSMSVTVHPLPDPVISDDNGTLSVAGTYDGYQWNLNGNTIPGATNATHQADEDGDYTITVTDGNGCTNTSAPLSYAVGVRPDIEPAFQVNIFPNPAQSMLHIRAPFGISVSLYTLAGKQVETTETGVMNISTLSDGMYLLQVRHEDGRLIKTEKLIKTR